MSLKQFIKLSHGLNPNKLSEVTVDSMNETLASIASKTVKQNRCYDNCLQLAMRLDASYVLGIVHHLIPIQHAWLKIGNVYYDPTLEVVLDTVPEGKYFALLEMPADELINFITEIDEISNEGVYPPMFETVKHHPKYSDCFFSNDYLRQFISKSVTI